MYTRPYTRRTRSITIPPNYSGNAFVEADSDHSEASFDEVADSLPSEEVSSQSNDAVKDKNTKGGFLPINISSEELLLIGIMILLFQSDRNDGLIPLLMAILFLGS